MQVQKNSVRRKILEIARKEFIVNGFKGTSMRTIAKKGEVNLSNIYNYFRNKDEIFREIVADVLTALGNMIERSNNFDDLDLFINDTEKYVREQIKMFIKLVDKFKEEFRLLFFKSAGSKLEDYREKCIEIHTQTEKRFIELAKQKYPSINNNVSEFFIHTMSSWFISSVAELVMHDLSGAELERFVSEYMNYSVAGWKKVMEIPE